MSIFITEAEADRRLRSKRNILSDNFERVPYERPEELGSYVPESAKIEIVSEREVQAILDDSNRVRNRDGSLRGQTDAQVAIGTVSNILGPSSAGALYNLSYTQSKAYGEGESSKIDVDRGITRNQSRRQAMNAVKDTLAEKAAQRLGSALDELTAEKIGNEKSAGNIARIAKDMAVVVDKVTKDSDKSESIHFHIFRPEMKGVSNYQIVNVSGRAEGVADDPTQS